MKGVSFVKKKKKKRILKGYLFWYIKELGVGACTYKIVLSIPLPWVEKMTFPALAAFFRVSTGFADCVFYIPDVRAMLLARTLR